MTIPVQPAKSPADTGEGETRLVRLITRFYRRWAYFVADHAVAIIVICTVITLIGTAKIVTTPNENDIQGYTPYGARARDELAISTEFFGSGISVFTLVLPLNGRNALDTDVLLEARRVEYLLTHNFTMYDKTTNKSETYLEFCYSFCQINDPFVMFTDALLLQRNLTEGGEEMNKRVNLTYPVATIYDRKVNIQPSFFGVELVNDTNAITNIKSAKMLAIHFRAERKNSWTTQQIKDFEMSITNYFEREFTSNSVRILTLSTTFVESEVVRAGMSLLPFLIVGFAIMATVSSLTTTMSALYMGQMSIHKFSLAIVACICPFMACGTALGALFYGGVRFGSILCVTPFLVLAIGVDDAYLMIHAWQRVTKHYRENPSKEDCAAGRLAEVLADTGPAIIISALTNILADAVGTYTGSPEITLLAYGNMACIFVDFIYQITFYSAVMVIAGRFEVDAERQKNFTQRICCGGDEDSIGSTETAQSLQEKINGIGGRLLDWYLDVVCNKIVDVFVMILWICFVVLSVYGITQMPINLTPKKLFSQDSSLIEMDDLRVEYVIPHFTLATLFVNNPGNLSDPKRLAHLNSFVEEMEHLPGAWGADSSNYFVRDFLEYERTVKEEENEEEEEEEGALEKVVENKNSTGLKVGDLETFIQWPEYEFWRGFVRLGHDNETGKAYLKKFFLTTAYQGEELRDWVQRDVILKRWRSVVDKYRDEFNISVFNDDGIYLDLIDNMPTDTWQSAVATLGCMALICFVFMFDTFTVVSATAVIASVMTGILGLLSLTGTELDPIVMAALIISIGFSVDIPAHVSYHYHTADRSLDARSRLRACLSSVGFPAVQASISTSLCVLSLLFVSIYMSQVFVKTMILCMSLCVIHGLLLIPCMASLVEPILSRCRRSAQ